jgi:ABC-type bacteriocin/lantibiotic exporter with double-glycine peptidase domain
MKKLIGIIIGLVLIGVVTYFGFSFYISQMTKEIVESSWKHENVLPEKYEGVLNLYTYKQLDWLNKASSTNVKAIKQDFSYPSTEWRINSATTTYSYTITNSDTGAAIVGCDNVKCTIEWEYQDGKWIVKSFKEG